MRDAFTLGMRSTQLCESLNNDLKHYLKSDLDIIHFMKQLKEFWKGKEIMRSVQSTNLERNYLD
jgi:hypothetical protein